MRRQQSNDNVRKSPSEHAGEYKNKIKVGNDGLQYISYPDTNGIYKWKLITEKKTPEEYMEQFKYMEGKKHIKKYAFPRQKLNVLTNNLKKIGVFLVHVGWVNVGNFSDFAFDDAYDEISKSKIGIEMKKNNIDIMNAISIIYYSEHSRYWSEIQGKLYLHFVIQRKDKQNIIDAFKNVFGRKFAWDGNKNHAMAITLDKL